MDIKISEQAYKGKFRTKENNLVEAYLFDAKPTPLSYSNAFVMYQDLNISDKIHILAGPKEIDEIIRVFEAGTLENVSEEELNTKYKNMLLKYINDNDLDLEEAQTSETTLEDLTIQAILNKNKEDENKRTPK